MRTLIAIVASIALASPAPAQTTRLHKFLYGMEAAACAASIGDALSTAAAINAGAHEANPLLVSRSTGRISWGKLIGYKALLCGAPIAVSIGVQHLPVKDRNAEFIALPLAITAAGGYGWATIHNIGVISEQKRINAAQTGRQ